MRPSLTIKIFNKPIHSFYFFGALGYILGLILGIFLAYFTGLRIWPVLLCGLTGACVLFGLTFLYKAIKGKDELVYYHHEIAILICCALLLYILRLPVLNYLDITLMGVGVFLSLGRIGCFSVGCCHGRISRRGVMYSSAHTAEGFQRHFVGIPIFPIQLVESTIVLVTVITGSWFILNHSSPGTAFLIYTVIYGAIRFALEYFRGDTARPYWLGFSEAQWTTLVIFVVTVILSLEGWLPHYSWHLFALPVLILWMIGATMFLRIARIPGYRLKQPTHVLELAEGLELLESMSAKGDLYLLSTSEGLNISMGSLQDGDYSILQYTISFKGGQNKSERITRVMDEATVSIVGKMIQTLLHLKGNFFVRREKPGIFSVLFPAHKKEVLESEEATLNLIEAPVYYRYDLHSRN